MALSHFMSRLGEHGLPLYKLLKMSDSFRSMNEMQKALDDLKALISKPPILASLEPDETLVLYVASTTQVVSTALVVERRNVGTSTRYKGRSITSARSSPTARPTTIRYKSYFMLS
jgi:dsDNA-binding SOS-regulon protein